MQKLFFLLIITFTMVSCTQPSHTEKELKKVLNTPLELTIFDTVLHNKSTLSFNQLRNAHEFLSVVYLQDGCNPCYPKFVEWHQKMEEIDAVPGHTLLFIIQTDEYYFNNQLAVRSNQLISKRFLVP